VISLGYNRAMTVHAFLSPHLDDAVYSCGGIIASFVSAGDIVIVITVFAGNPEPGPISPFAAGMQERWGVVESPMVARRAEDRMACGRLGASVVHLQLPDAIYRRDVAQEPLYGTEESLFLDINPQETQLPERIQPLLKGVVPPEAKVYCPLAVGGHVDHRIVRSAADGLFYQVHYYHELPYAARDGEIPATLPALQGERLLLSLADLEIESWAQAAGEYRSQLSTFWEDYPSLLAEIQAYHDEHGGVPLELITYR
jgi:LmbE family N-acetylglucosaminyl deacetylase